MLSYPVRLIPENGGLVLSFPDVPEAIVTGADEEEVFGRALTVLETALGGYILEGRPIPPPSDICAAPTVTTKRFSLVGMDV